MDDFEESEFNDAADWNLASYTHHPVDDLEPLPDRSSLYRDASVECLRILAFVDRFVSRAADPRFAWITVSLALGLDSTAGLSQAQISRQLGLSEPSLRRATAKFAKLAGIGPGGVRSLDQIQSNGGPALNGNGQNRTAEKS